MRQLSRRVVIAGITTALAACNSITLPVGGEPASVPQDPISIENATLVGDGMSVRIDFVGGREFHADDPCSVAYEGTAAVVGDELEIGIYAQQHPEPLPPGAGCDAMGHSRNLTLPLEEPFTGTVVRDLAGHAFLLEPPPGVPQVSGLPDGWELRREGNVLGTSTLRWQRIWSQDSDPWPAEGDSMVTLIHAFDGPVDTVGGDRQPAVEVNGHAATFYLHAPSGEMVLVWSLDDDELALVGNLVDFTQTEFIALAESVSLLPD